MLGSMLHEVNTPGIGAIGQAAGLDFLIYDMEHSGFGWDSIRAAMATCRGLRLQPIVRVPATRSDYISRALDIRGAGVMVPFVDSAAQAREIATAAKYPPLGRRGVAAGVAHDDFIAGDTGEMLQRANREKIVFAQIESEAGVEEAGAIAATAGLDVIFVGHYDLSCSLGVPGDVGHPKVRSAVGRILGAVRQNHKAAGRMVFTLDQLDEALADGFSVIAYQSDIGILRAGFAQAVDHVRGVARDSGAGRA